MTNDMTIIALMQSTDYSSYIKLMEVLDRYHHESLPAVFLPGPFQTLTQDEYLKLLGRIDRRLFGAFVDGQLCGLVLVRRVEAKVHPIFRSEATCHVDEVIVDPDFRRRGIARWLIGAAENWAAEQGSSVMSLSVFEFNEPARSLYEQSGYETEKRIMIKRFHAPMGGGKDAIQIRAATLSDVSGIAKVHVDVWNSTYTGIVPQTFLNSRTYEGMARQWENILADLKPRHHVYVATDGANQVIGFTAGGATRDDALPFDGELYAVYLLREHQGRGVGRRLFQATVSRLAADGFSGMLLWVLADNSTSRFYDHMGGVVCAEKIEEIGGKALKELGYGWSSLHFSRDFN